MLQFLQFPNDLFHRQPDDIAAQPLNSFHEQVTVFLNGVLLHHMRALQGPTKFRALAQYTPQSSYGAIELQDHGDPVRFRNIWCRPLSIYGN